MPVSALRATILATGLKAFAHDPRLSTALHEAGHAVRAYRRGLFVLQVSIVADKDTLGHVKSRGVPKPQEADCEPGAALWREAALVTLAGDRAGRLLDPEDESCLGGPSSDYWRTEELVEAVIADEAKTESTLQQLVDELDEWLLLPRVQADLLTVTVALLERNDLSGDELAQLLAGGNCGAFGPDGLVCASRRHRYGRHGCLVDPYSLEVVWQYWEGWMPTPTPKGHRPTARLLRVRRALGWEPPLPPRKRGLTHAQFQELRRKQAAGELTEHEGKAMLRYMAARTREKRVAALATPAWHQGDTARTGHPTDCPDESEFLADQSNPWCSACCYEPTPTPGFVYQLVWRSHDGERVEDTVESGLFATSQQALTALRLARTRSVAAQRHLRVRREPLPRPARLAPHPDGDASRELPHPPRVAP